MMSIPALPIETADGLDALRDVREYQQLAQRYETARHELRLAGLLDQMLRAQSASADTPQRIRSLDSYAEVPVAFAFDLVAAVPTITPLPPDER